MKWVKIDVKPCANGLLCACEYDPEDGTVVVFDRVGYALGYFEVSTAVKLKLDNTTISRTD